MKIHDLEKNYNSQKIWKFITFFFSEKSTRWYLYFKKEHDWKFFQKILPAEFHGHKITEAEKKDIKEIFKKNFKLNIKNYEESK